MRGSAAVALALGAGIACSLALAGCSSQPRPSVSPNPTAAIAAERGRLADSARGTVRTLGVPPFAIDGGTSDSVLSPLAYGLADLLTTDLARSRRVTLVERARLGEVLRELDLTAAGRVDSSTAPRVGRLVLARRLIVGSVASVPNGARQLRIGVRIADVQSGVVDGSIDATAPLADILAAEKALAFRVFDQLGVALAPDERAAVEQRPTGNLGALLAYGNGVRLEYLGDYRGAAAEFRRALRLDPGFHAASERAKESRAQAESGAPDPLLVPGIRAVDAVVGLTIDRLNRPLDAITTLTPNARVGDPSFPTTAATVVIVVTRP